MEKRTQIEHLAAPLPRAAVRVLRLVRVQDTASGIAPARLSALSVIVFGGPISLRGLARAEQVTSPTMSRIVDALEVDGLARRRVNQQDRRALLIEATEKGAVMLKDGRKRRVKFLASYLSQLDTSELSDIERAVRAVQKALQQV